MLNTFFHFLFLIFTVYVLVQSISYGIFEIRQEKNTFGGSSVIVFSVFCVIFGNVIVWIN